MEQRYADVALEKGHGAADSGRRASELAAGSSEAAFVEGGDEDLHRVDAIHRLLRILHTECRIISIQPITPGGAQLFSLR